MVSLILDCSAGMNIYLIKDDKIFSEIDNNQKKHTDELLLCVEKMLLNADLKVADINNICVCVGPGSFTGIRVAISICKGFAVGTNIKVFVASNFDIIRNQQDENAIYVLEGFSKYVYYREVFNDTIIKEDCISIDELVLKIETNFSKYNIYAQNEKVQNLLKSIGIVSNIAKNQTVLHFLDKINKNQFVSLNQISPMYLRMSQAEMERKLKLLGDK